MLKVKRKVCDRNKAYYINMYRKIACDNGERAANRNKEIENNERKREYTKTNFIFYQGFRLNVEFALPKSSRFSIFRITVMSFLISTRSFSRS